MHKLASHLPMSGPQREEDVVVTVTIFHYCCLVTLFLTGHEPHTLEVTIGVCQATEEPWGKVTVHGRLGDPHFPFEPCAQVKKD